MFFSLDPSVALSPEICTSVYNLAKRALVSKKRTEFIIHNNPNVKIRMKETEKNEAI